MAKGLPLIFFLVCVLALSQEAGATLRGKDIRSRLASRVFPSHVMNNWMMEGSNIWDKEAESAFLQVAALVDDGHVLSKAGDKGQAKIHNNNPEVAISRDANQKAIADSEKTSTGKAPSWDQPTEHHGDWLSEGPNGGSKGLRVTGLERADPNDPSAKKAAQFATLDLQYGHHGQTYTSSRAPWKLQTVESAAKESPKGTRWFLTIKVEDGLGATWREQVVVYQDAPGFGEGFKVLKQHLVRLSLDAHTESK